MDKLAIKSIDDLGRISKMIAATEFAPKEYRNNPRAVGVAIMWGAELGLGPLQSLQSIAVINGKPAVYGDALIALCLAHPDCEDIQEEYHEETKTALCTVKRKGQIPHSTYFSEADAKAAGLWGKQGPWKQYPKRMLQMRARGFALRDKFADALRGIITVEEAQDYPTEVTTVKWDDVPATDSHVDHSEAQTPEPAPQQDGPVFKFGKYKEYQLSDPDVITKDLEWYRDAVAKSVDDPNKAKYKKYNIDHLREIDNEIAVREENMRDAQHDHISQDVAPPHTDDDMPF